MSLGFILAVAMIFMWILIFGVGGAIVKGKEQEIWNNGICKQSGQPWIHFDTDSQGGRGYKDNHGNYAWISYSVDKVKY